MGREELVLQVTVSDPWEFVDSSGSNVLWAQSHQASIENGRPGFRLLLELDEPVRASAAEATAFFVVEASDDYQALQDGDSIECRLTGVAEVQLEGADPFNVSGWRGRFPAARAQLRRV